MKTEIVAVDACAPDPEMMERAGAVLKSGGLVAFPTETVYGLGGDALRADASRKIYEAKGRPSDNPLIVHIADMEHLAPVAQEVPEGAIRLAEELWPGPLTMIFKKTALIPDETSGGLPTVAVRMPSHPVANALIRFGGGYVAAPSANISGRPSPTCAAHVIEDLSGRVDMILDGGNADIGLESTIVDFTEGIPMVLRPGYVRVERLREILGEVRIDPGILGGREDPSVRPKAPGMRYRHYAPRAPLMIVEGETEQVIRQINLLVQEDKEAGRCAGVISTKETAGAYEAADVRIVGSREDEASVARGLFGVLRDFDADGVDVIYSESFSSPGLGMAIMNRLLKAAGHRVLRL